MIVGLGSPTKNLWQLINTLTGRVKAHCAPRADLEDLSKPFSAVVTDTSRPARLIPPAADHWPLEDNPPCLEAFSTITTETVYEHLVAIFYRRDLSNWLRRYTRSVAEAVRVDPCIVTHQD